MGAVHSSLIFDFDSDPERVRVGGTDVSNRNNKMSNTSLMSILIRCFLIQISKNSLPCVRE